MTNLDQINALPETEARTALGRCCGATRWATQMAARRPFGAEAEMLAAA